MIRLALSRTTSVKRPAGGSSGHMPSAHCTAPVDSSPWVVGSVGIVGIGAVVVIVNDADPDAPVEIYLPSVLRGSIAFEASSCAAA